MENIGAGVSAVLTPKKKEVEEREVDGETTMEKQYNARGEKIYKNAINRENAKKTTIVLSRDIVNKLCKRKTKIGDTYDQIINDLINTDENIKNNEKI